MHSEHLDHPAVESTDGLLRVDTEKCSVSAGVFVQAALRHFSLMRRIDPQLRVAPEAQCFEEAVDPAQKIMRAARESRSQSDGNLQLQQDKGQQHLFFAGQLMRSRAQVFHGLHCSLNRAASTRDFKALRGILFK